MLIVYFVCKINTLLSNCQINIQKVIVLNEKNILFAVISLFLIWFRNIGRAYLRAPKAGRQTLL